jgi:Fe-S oxidoreductase
MCPSYRATREEMHATRGRARLLWEALIGDVIGGWKDEHVKEALDLCLSCKGCKGECPVKVDMATYKAEFLAHYYEHRLRPLNAYAFGYIDKWARLARFAPSLASSMANSALSKRLLGVPPQRTVPRFAKHSFTSTFVPMGKGTKVILWPDTFNNYFHPQVARAAADVLVRAGCEVHVPRQALCCGRPLYEFGLLDSARAYLRRVLDALEQEIRAGTPIIGLEPACVTVFREELPNLLARDEQAMRLSRQVFLFSEYLARHAPSLAFGRLERRVLVHAHCHHQAVLKTDALRELLERLGADFEILDSGCCGMAGSFGFEQDKYDVSVKCAERVLLPAVKRASADTLVVTNGFSCRAQIEQLAGQRPLHVAELLRATF